MLDYLPMFCQIRDKTCLLVGGGQVAERKARLLLDAGAHLLVNAREFTPQFEIWGDNGQVTLIRGEFEPHWLEHCWLVIAATNDAAVNGYVCDCATERRIFCNVVDEPQQASFITPSVIDRSPLVIAISSGGNAPVLVRLWREKLERLLPMHLGRLAAYGGTLRQRVKRHFHHLAARRHFWERFFTNERLMQSLVSQDRQQVDRVVETLFSESSQANTNKTNSCSVTD
ncbi:siroheme synthase [Photorhabdus bodei]|uniref:precorrin-2 dehydrogenase n=1 Tax=Photorhabdus bodei TaxID=2029681 RepID=A0A329XE61_9GAMM|nr:siroheme synthase [Photorhabdus bodei]RAW96098.1 siroheme synthase [Photorhabdus sp. S9-53]RAW96165.1 siroheme synthase [Photorhabdus sp. S10-54]RAX00225.1 siroheme synthase [Photorhabdus sp. S8-52]NDL01913.1 siroheme synthase [Photorhabdus bodei]